MRFSVLIIILILVLPLFAVSKVNSDNGVMVRLISLHIDATLGWNYTIPGPMIQIIKGETVIVTMEAHDDQNHQSYADGLESGFRAGFWNANYTFSYPSDYNVYMGNFTYVDMLNPNCWGILIVRPDFPTFIQSYSSTTNSSKWQPLSDFNGDGTVSLADLVSYARLCGEKVLWTQPLPMTTEP